MNRIQSPLFAAVLVVITASSGLAADDEQSATKSESTRATKSFDKETVDRNLKEKAGLTFRPAASGGGYFGLLPFEGGPVLSSTLGLKASDMPFWIRIGLEARLSNPFQLITGWANHTEITFKLGMTYDFRLTESLTLHPLGSIHAGGNLGWGWTTNAPTFRAQPAFGFSMGGMLSWANGVHVVILGHYPATPMVLNEPGHPEPYETYVGSRVFFTARVGWMWEFPFAG